MRAVPSKFFFAAVLSLILISNLLNAQESGSTLSGAVSDSSGKAIANAALSLKNSGTGQSVATSTDASGSYSFANLSAGDYEITVSAPGFAALTQKVTVGGASQQLQVTMTPAAPTENLPEAPSSIKTEPSQQSQPSLEDLGFGKAETQANPEQQALLDKRTRMLRIHQRMGLITTIPLIATVVTSFNAGGKNESSSSRDLHVALGAVTGDLYGITAWYAIRAPRIKGTKKRGPIRFHEAMAWIHGPGMIATPILGAIAFSQKNNGEKVHGIAQAHGPVAIVTAGAFGAALLSVSLKF